MEIFNIIQNVVAVLIISGGIVLAFFLAKGMTKRQNEESEEKINNFIKELEQYYFVVNSDENYYPKSSIVKVLEKYF